MGNFLCHVYLLCSFLLLHQHLNALLLILHPCLLVLLLDLILPDINLAEHVLDGELFATDGHAELATLAAFRTIMGRAIIVAIPHTTNSFRSRLLLLFGLLKRDKILIVLHPNTSLIVIVLSGGSCKDIGFLWVEIWDPWMTCSNRAR